MSVNCRIILHRASATCAVAPIKRCRKVVNICKTAARRCDSCYTWREFAIFTIPGNLKYIWPHPQRIVRGEGFINEARTFSAIVCRIALQACGHRLLDATFLRLLHQTPKKWELRGSGCEYCWDEIKIRNHVKLVSVGYNCWHSLITKELSCAK